MKRGRESVKRVQKILVRDKLKLPDNYQALLTADVNKLFSHYMILSPPGAYLRIKVQDNGSYEIGVTVIADRIKDVPTVLPPLNVE